MLIITGTLAFDYIMDFPGQFSDHILPDQLHKINLSFAVDKFARRRGGTAGNVSYNLALLKTEQILFTAAGSDFEGYKSEFEKLGIETKHILIDRKNYTSTGFAITDKTDNQIWGYFYGASDKIASLKLDKVAKKRDLVLIGPSGAAGSMNFVRQCVKSGVKYFFDPGFILTQVSDDDLKLGIKHAEYIAGNDYEITLIKKRIQGFDELVSGKVLITTLGEKGALIESGGKVIKIKPVKVEKAVDPTGAGDAWRAGFLAGISRGFDLQTCGQMGALAAAYAVECYGTQEHKFTKSQFTKRYEDAYNTEIKL